jgi:SAM-dependent methyltransferase
MELAADGAAARGARRRAAAKGAALMNAAAVVIRCADATGRVWTTLRSVERQTMRSEVVLVADPSTPPGAVAWLRAVADSRGHQLVLAGSERPAAVKNAGIRATTAAVVACVDAGCELHPTFLSQTAPHLDDAATAAAATWVEWVGPGPRVVVDELPPVTLAGCLAHSRAVSDAAVIRRRDWLDAGGFDESLPSLEALDLWLWLLSHSRTIAMVPQALASYVVERGALYQSARDGNLRAGAMSRVLHKHRALFEAHVADALAEREARLLPMAHRYRPLLAGRDASLAEVERTRARVQELLGGRPFSSAPPQVGGEARATPLARDWGFSRGTPVDRYYINAFLEACAADVRGVVLDVQEADNARRIGGERIARVDVIDVDAANPRATVVADLRCAPNLAAASYDCIVLTQTLHLVDDMPAVVAECARLLRPGGVLLATMPCASRLANEYGPAHDHWRVTPAAARRLFGEQFGAGVRVESWGNVAATAGFLYGLGVHELAPATLDFHDPHYPLLVTVRAQK